MTVAVVVAALMVFGVVPAASAHVHAFTPLGCLTTDNPNSGAVVGFVKAADAAAPMNGDTPIIPWNASGKLPSGGEGAANAC
ncbi:MAG TPA: hypothetical protein VF148_17260 [Acidimicrobiia bacterium]